MSGVANIPRNRFGNFFLRGECMKKIVIIGACVECPNFLNGCGYGNNCDITNKVILHEEKIPEWCPLQDARDYVIKEK